MFLCHFVFFFFNDTATTEIYTLSLHDALPIYLPEHATNCDMPWTVSIFITLPRHSLFAFHWREREAVRHHQERTRSEEHTSELQSLAYLVCRLLLEKKKKK